jgi:glycosyltransferase involved in cell wall biosynthesis
MWFRRLQSPASALSHVFFFTGWFFFPVLPPCAGPMASCRYFPRSQRLFVQTEAAHLEPAIHYRVAVRVLRSPREFTGECAMPIWRTQATSRMYVGFKDRVSRKSRWSLLVTAFTQLTRSNSGFRDNKMRTKKANIPTPPPIAPVPDGTRPFWSVMIPTYNCAHFLRETLLSVLSQDPGMERMEIEVVDDCSTKDDPEAVVRELGHDRVKFYKQPRNTGPIGNFNTCIQRSRGQWIHILHGDDTVRPGFYARAENGITKNPDIGAVTFRYLYVFEDGHWQHLAELQSRTAGILGAEFIERMMFTNEIMFPAMIVRRSAYECLGAFRPELVHCADWDMWLRVVLYSPTYYDPEPLACYRIHAGADTARLVSTGENVRDERRFIQILPTYVPPERARAVQRKGRRVAAIRATRRAQDLWRKGYRSSALIQLREAARTSLAPPVIMHFIRVAAWALVREPSTSPAAQELSAQRPNEAAWALVREPSTSPAAQDQELNAQRPNEAA